MHRLRMCGRLLVSAVLVVMTSQAETLSIPMISTRGSHYQVGYDVGKTFSKQIQEYFKLNGNLHPYFIPWSKTSAGQKMVQYFLTTANISRPQYIQEMTGIADGAQVDFMEVFMMNIRSELSAIVRPDAEHQAESCTDIHINHPKLGSVGYCHNEDADPAVYGRGYIVHAVIYGDPHAHTPDEDITAYCYPGEIPGNAFGFNAAGVTFSVNALYPKLVLPNKIPRSILTRHMMTARTIDQAVEIITAKGLGAAYGFTVNMGYVYHSSAPSIVSVECAPSSTENQTLTNIYWVKPASETDSGNYYHVNLFRHFNISERSAHTVSSVHRTKRINELKPPSIIQEALGILSDTHDSSYPIYRTGTPEDKSRTVATGAFDLMAGTLSVYSGKPGLSPGPLYVLPFKH